MRIKTLQLQGIALDWAVAKCEEEVIVFDGEFLREPPGQFSEEGVYSPSSNWAQGGPIIERENITLVRLESESIPDSKGYWQGKYRPVWAAIQGIQHDSETLHSSYGEPWGEVYGVDVDTAITASTPLIAAMRCYVASKLGDEIDIPNELGE